MNAVMLRAFLPVGMPAASGHNRDIGAFTDIKVVVYQIIHIAVRDARGDINSLSIGTGFY